MNDQLFGWSFKYPGEWFSEALYEWLSIFQKGGCDQINIILLY